MAGVDEWTVPGYAEERLLGRGVAGRVVAAVSETTGRRVAIKYLDDNLVLRNADFLRTFRAETDKLKSLDSPHVARLIDFVEQPDRGAAVVTALVPGVSLRQTLNSGWALGAEAALVVLKDCLLGLAAGQSLGLLHRDLKPENVLIDAEGQCTLTDFGIAVKTSKRVPAAGTPAYMAPELWNGAPNAPTTDAYAATAVLWESVTGQPPFSGGLRQLHHLHKSAQVPVERFEQPIQGLVAWGLAKNPANRPESAQSFADHLDARATAAYGPEWEDHGRADLRERAAALLALPLPDKGARYSQSATASRLARRKRRTIILVGATAAAALVALAAVALPAMSGKAQLTSLTSAATAAQVIVSPPVAASNCATSTTFTYSGTVTAVEAGTLSYEWLYSSGKHGPVQTLNFTAAGNREVAGGTVTTSKAGAGWAELKVLSAIPKTSNKATYRLLCTTADSGITLSASVRPKAQTMSSCAAAPPKLTATGSITTKKAESVTYYWALADGQNSSPRTVTFKAAGTKTLAALKIAPRALPASGEAVLVVTKPVAAASKPAKYTVSCTVPVSITPGSPALVTSPATTSKATSSRSPVKSSPSPSHSKAPTSKPTSAAPTTSAAAPSSSASTPPSSTPASSSPASPPDTSPAPDPTTSTPDPSGS
jgi:serine/threonine-protein kinase